MSTDEVETRARTMGWLPKEKFRGKEDNWLPADKYLERGEQILPLLLANNRDLANSVAGLETVNAKLTQQLKEASEAIEGLKDFRSSITKDRATTQKKELTTAIINARNAGDVDAEVELTGKLGEVTAALKEAEKPPEKKPTPTTEAPQLNAHAKTWMAENPWFGTDKRKTGYAAGLRDEWTSQGKPVSTPEFFAYLDEEMGKMFDPNAERRTRQKVDASNNSSGGSGSEGGGKTFADLPPEAKAQCKKDSARLVGPNRAYKTEAEWQAVYISQYDWS